MILGIDIGGTFTDFVLYDKERGILERWKVLSTPSKPEKAVLSELMALGDAKAVEIIHGSTVATNALLERTGARTAFVTTQGFRDILAIGRQNRESLYDFFADRPTPLIPSDLCIEVNERVNFKGEILLELSPADVQDLLVVFGQAEIESICLCLLFSFLQPCHEMKLAEALRAAGYSVSASHEILPEFREYERASTTAINAYIAPVLQTYLKRLESQVDSSKLRIMQSNGGSVKVKEALRAPVKTILSGPAAGVVGAVHVAQQAGLTHIITMDMGGTSTDVSLYAGHIPITKETTFDGLPIRIPMIDIHSVGAGGGSIAEIDLGGALRVGPRSAGAKPGPVCYGLGGTEPTVTDANLVLGRIVPDAFFAGKLELDLQAATRALEGLQRLGRFSSGSEVTPAQQAALGVIQVVNAHMLRALQVISVERGHHPKDFSLVSFGGAGGLHACELAMAMGIRNVLIPQAASTLSAFGMLTADGIKDYVLTVMLNHAANYQALSEAFRPMRDQGLKDLLLEGFTTENIQLFQEIEVRYQGQSHELVIPFTPEFRLAFHLRHKEVYGYQFPERNIEIVNLRLRAIGRKTPPPVSVKYVLPTETQTPIADATTVILQDQDTGSARLAKVPLINRETLQPSAEIEGPAVLLQPDTTVFIPENVRAQVDNLGNLVLSIEM